jgi:hypothetical protein
MLLFALLLGLLLALLLALPLICVTCADCPAAAREPVEACEF